MILENDGERLDRICCSYLERSGNVGEINVPRNEIVSGPRRVGSGRGGAVINGIGTERLFRLAVHIDEGHGVLVRRACVNRLVCRLADYADDLFIPPAEGVGVLSRRGLRGILVACGKRAVLELRRIQQRIVVVNKLYKVLVDRRGKSRIELGVSADGTELGDLVSAGRRVVPAVERVGVLCRRGLGRIGRRLRDRRTEIDVGVGRVRGRAVVEIPRHRILVDRIGISGVERLVGRADIAELGDLVAAGHRVVPAVEREGVLRSRGLGRVGRGFHYRGIVIDLRGLDDRRAVLVIERVGVLINRVLRRDRHIFGDARKALIPSREGVSYPLGIGGGRRGSAGIDGILLQHGPVVIDERDCEGRLIRRLNDHCGGNVREILVPSDEGISFDDRYCGSRGGTAV